MSHQQQDVENGFQSFADGYVQHKHENKMCFKMAIKISSHAVNATEKINCSTALLLGHVVFVRQLLAMVFAGVRIKEPSLSGC